MRVLLFLESFSPNFHSVTYEIMIKYLVTVNNRANSLMDHSNDYKLVPFELIKIHEQSIIQFDSPLHYSLINDRIACLMTSVC